MTTTTLHHPTVVPSYVLHHILKYAFDTTGAISQVLGEWAVTS